MKNKTKQFVDLIDKSEILNESILWWAKQVAKLEQELDSIQDQEQALRIKSEMESLLVRGDLEIKNIDTWLEQKDAFLNAKTKK